MYSLWRRFERHEQNPWNRHEQNLCAGASKLYTNDRNASGRNQTSWFVTEANVLVRDGSKRLAS